MKFLGSQNQNNNELVNHVNQWNPRDFQIKTKSTRLQTTPIHTYETQFIVIL